MKTPKGGDQMHLESPKRITVALPISRLQDHAPRGVVRVARAIAERLVSDPKLHLLAISDPIFHRSEMIFEAWDLAQWLADNPLMIPRPRCEVVERTVATNHHPRVRFAGLKRLLTKLGLRRPAKLAIETVRRTTSAAKRVQKKMTAVALTLLAHQVRRVTQGNTVQDESRVLLPLKRVRCVAESRPSGLVSRDKQSKFVSMRDLQALVSFECYEAIWDWPTELYDCKLIGFFHDAIPLRINEGPGWNPGFFHRSIAKMVQRADCIVCDSKSAESDLHTFYPNAQSKTQVLYLGHDLERFTPNGSLNRSRARDGVTPSRGPHVPTRSKVVRKIAMIGELEPRKNQSGVFRACRHLAAMRPTERIVLVLIGRLPDQHPYRCLEQVARQYVDIQHLGYVPDDRIGDVLRSCDAFIYPSLWEGFGIPVLEAMSAGVPVVCAENSSLTEVGGTYAFYCDPYDPASIASAVSRALSLSNDERHRWVEEARRWAQQFNWDSTTDHLAELIHERIARARSKKVVTEIHPAPHNTGSLATADAQPIVERGIDYLGTASWRTVA